MVELTCKNCGGRLSAADDDVFVGDGTAILQHGSMLQCEHCGTECAPGQELALRASIDVTVHQQIESVESGGTAIGARIDLGKSE